MTSVPLPPGTRLHPDSGLRSRNGGRLLLGGSPLRFVRLTEPGAALVKRWFGGEAPSAGAGPTAVARRLIGAGMAHPEPAADVGIEPLTVVIPVKDDHEGLSETLRRLGPVPVVIVDDGSRIPVTVGEGNPDSPTVIRREQSGGPGVARQEGLAVVTTQLVAFVDAGVDVTSAQLDQLARWFADPTIAAVGPRVASKAKDDGLLARYEENHSPLDLGAAPAPVGHGRLVSYLPTACLVARRKSVDSVGGFDSALRFGEDVDLVWRLLAQGAVRYDPGVVVGHPPRADVAHLVRQRFGYGLAAAPLAERHGRELAPVRVSRWSLAVLALLLARRPVTAGSLATYTAFALSRKLSRFVPNPQIEAVLLAARGHWWAGVSVADAAVRIWWPLTALAAFTPFGRAVRGLVALAWLRKAASIDGDLAERARLFGLGVVDDVAYGAGVWVGAWRERSPRCLLPLLVDWPGNPDARNPEGTGTGEPAPTADPGPRAAGATGR